MRKNELRKTQTRSAGANIGPAGVVGQGVMGAIIATSLLAAGCPVFAVALEDGERRTARRRVRRHLEVLHTAGRLAEPPEDILRRYRVAGSFEFLRGCEVVVESIIEDLAAKRTILARVEEIVDDNTIIGSNTSGLSVTEIQCGVARPQRVLGLHWISSSPFGSMVEVMGGAQTEAVTVSRAAAMVRSWGMEPAVLQHEKRGFICNRVLYALFREALALLEEGVASPQEIDDVIRASTGTWLPFVGPLEYMDLSGLPVYPAIAGELFPDLSKTNQVPQPLRAVVDAGGQGATNDLGFYCYEPGGGAKRRRQMDDFRRDLSLLNASYEYGRKLRKAGASSRAATAPKPKPKPKPGKRSAFSGY